MRFVFLVTKLTIDWLVMKLCQLPQSPFSFLEQNFKVDNMNFRKALIFVNFRNEFQEINEVSLFNEKNMVLNRL